MEDKDMLKRIEFLEKELAKINGKKGLKGIIKQAFTRMNVLIGVVCTLLISSLILYAAQITFSDGEVISAEEVNANFTELYDDISSLQNETANLSESSWLKNGDDLYFSEGNVGIGNDSPEAMLDVNGSVITGGGDYDHPFRPDDFITKG